MKEKSVAVAVSATFFQPGPTSQSIIIKGIQAIGSGYLNALKNTSFDEVSKWYEGTPMMYIKALSALTEIQVL